MFPPDAPLLRHATTEVHGRYFVRAPQSSAKRWLVGFHGQSQTADAFLVHLELVPRPSSCLVASIQGLNRYYAGRTQAIVASWMTRQDRELAIADNVGWVDRVLDELEREFGAPEAIVFAGFSQGVAMAYRAGLLGRRPCAAIAAVCGDVPPELKTVATRRWPHVLAMTGSRDEWYTPARLQDDVTLLKSVGADVQSIIFDGGHEWSTTAADAVGGLIGLPARDAGSLG
jgi:predicted esterase